MLWRFCSFLLCQFGGALLGWWLSDLRGALLGMATAGSLWFAIDLLRGFRVLQWLRRADASSVPAVAGLWGEIADRTRRQLRSREQQTAEAQARLQEFLAAIQASPNGVMLLDAQGRIEWCNQTAAAQFGIDVQRDLLQHIGNLVRDPVFSGYYSAADYSQEVVMQGRDSVAERPVKLALHLNPYGNGRKLLVSRDITAMEQADIMRRDFVANVSHEIRTPLTVLSGFIETLQNLNLSEAERAHYLDLMAQQSQRMQTLVNDLLTLSRLEGSPPPSASEWTPVQTLLVECEQEARGLTSLLEQPSHLLHFEVAQAARIAGSHGELLSAMSNLTNNAIRYTPAGGSVSIKWQVLGDGRGEFTVEDSGPGIAAEHIPRLTERFYRVDRSRSRETGGTGLGLAIVKHVVQRHGGELRIESRAGQGSRFSIFLPASRIRPA